MSVSLCGARSAEIEGALRARLATADRILRLAALCRKAESEAERVAPFGALAALTPGLPTETLALASPRELAGRLADLALGHQAAARIAAAEAHLPPQLATCIVQELTEEAAGVPKLAPVHLPKTEPAGWADDDLIQVHYPNREDAGGTPCEALTAGGAPEQAGGAAAGAGVSDNDACELVGAQDLAAESQEALLAHTGFSMDSELSADGATGFMGDQEAAEGSSPVADALAADGGSPVGLHAPGSSEAEVNEQDMGRASARDSGPASLVAASLAPGTLVSASEQPYDQGVQRGNPEQAEEELCTTDGHNSAEHEPLPSTALQAVARSAASPAGRSGMGSRNVNATDALALPAAPGGVAAEQGGGWCHALDERGRSVPRERLLDNAYRRCNKARAVLPPHARAGACTSPACPHELLGLRVQLRNVESAVLLPSLQWLWPVLMQPLGPTHGSCSLL